MDDTVKINPISLAFAQEAKVSYAVMHKSLVDCVDDTEIKIHVSEEYGIGLDISEAILKKYTDVSLPAEEHCNIDDGKTKNYMSTIPAHE